MHIVMYQIQIFNFNQISKVEISLKTLPNQWPSITTCLRFFFLLIRVIIAKARKSIRACQSNKILGSEQFLLSIIRWKHHLRYKRDAVRFFLLNTDESNLMFRGVNFRVVSLEVGDVVIERFEGRILAKLRLLSKLGGLITAIK